ncbi:AzlC family ABC transporter permease [Halorussus amylolyticus]|uniref:AzlC family ABC transporter permease n=1 Tax=Halorussus amylolyticus TaxID=1126242 RepID=UPI001046368D|nr:AzlC family ABC transporter permease [Halorussus amylolyticus]
MSEARSEFLSGVRDVLPALPANVPFGIIAGVATVGVGIDAGQALAFAGLLFAGAAQVAAVELVGDRAPIAVVVLTALVVNLRYVMYSASIATHFESLSARWKAVTAFFLLDVTYALSIARFDADRPDANRWYYLGTALPLWVVWVGASAVGISFGSGVPDHWQLDFAIPLLFMALLFSALDDAASYVASAASGVLAVAGFGLPFNAGILVAAAGGIAAGVLADGVADE